MNNRDYKDLSVGEIYHIYNRGVGKMNIFLDDQDLRVFRARLKENLYPESIDHSLLPKHATRRKTLPSNSYDLISYCLMPNHFHFLIKQNTELSITQLLLKVCTGYSKYFNKKYNRVGPIFQDSFKAARIERNNQLLWVSYYIHKNPLQAELVKNLKDYKWNSFGEYLESDDNDICKKKLVLEQFKNKKSYLDYFLNQEFNKELEENIISNSDLLIDFDIDTMVTIVS